MSTGSKKKGKASKRAGVPPRREPQKPVRSRIEWAQVVGQVVIILLIIVVPVVLNIRSNNVCDVKDVVLGLGVAAGLGLWLLASLAKGEISWAKSRLNTVVLAFVAWSAVSVVYARYRYVTISELGRLTSHLALFWLVILCLRRLAQVRRVLGWAAIGAVPVLGYAFYQKSGRDFIPWSEPVTRVFSFLANPTYFGGYLMLLIPVMIACGVMYLQTDEERPERRRSWGAYVLAGCFFAVAAAMLLCLYLSVTLSGMIGLGLAMVVAFVLVIARGGRRAARWAIPAAALSVVVLMPVGYLGYSHLDAAQKRRVQQVIRFQDPFAEERRLHWRTALGIFRERPIVGEGYGAFRVYSLEKMASEWYAQDARRSETMLVPGYAHNEYLQMLADTGLIGGVLFLGMALGALGLGVWLTIRHPSRRWATLCLAISAAMTAFLFQNFFGVTFRQAGAVTFYWVWLGALVLAAASIPRPGTEETGDLLLHATRFRRVPVWGWAPVGAALAALWWFVLWPVAMDPMYASMDVRLAKRLAAQGDYRAAAQLADHAVSLCPYSFVGYYTSGFAWGQTGDYEKAVAANKKALELMPGNASVYYNLGVAYKEKGDLDQALASFKRAVELMPTSYKHQAAMAETFSKQGKLKEALPYAQGAARLSRHSKDEASCYLLLADICNRLGRVTEMTAALKQASWLDPNSPKLKQQLAFLYFKNGDVQMGARMLRQWIQLDPNAAMAHNVLGTYYLGRQQYPEAKAEFERAVQIDPNYAVARFNLGLTYGRMKNMGAAVAQFREVVARAPDSPEGKRARQVLDKLGRQASAGRKR